MKFLFIIFLFPLQAFTQNISGVWKGNLYNDTTKQLMPYELAVNDENGKLNGFSYTVFLIDSIKNVGVKSVKIENKDERFFIEDEKLVYNNYAEPPAKGVRMFSVLSYSANDSAEVLSGSWNTNRTKDYNPLTGSIFLEKKKEISQTAIIQKLNEIGLSKKLLSWYSKEYGEEKNGEKGLAAVNKQQKQEENNAGLNQKRKDGEEAKKEKVEEKVRDENNMGTDKNITIVTDKKTNQDAKIKKEESANIFNNQPIEKEKEKKPEKSLVALKEKEQNNLKTPVIKEEPLTINKIPVIPPAAEIAFRKIETIKTVEIFQDSLILSLFDNGIIDGDTVSVLINGIVVWPRVGLLEKATNKTIYLTPEMGDSISVVMYAESLGSIPPNTGLLVVRDGKINHEIRFSGDLKKNSAIILKRKKG